MRAKTLALIHKQVVHGRLGHEGRCQTHSYPDPAHCRVCVEEREIKKWADDLLKYVCEDCFGSKPL